MVAVALFYAMGLLIPVVVGLREALRAGERRPALRIVEDVL